VNGNYAFCRELLLQHGTLSSILKNEATFRGFGRLTTIANFIYATFKKCPTHQNSTLFNRTAACVTHVQHISEIVHTHKWAHD
jgi:hypothetical protein